MRLTDLPLKILVLSSLLASAAALAAPARQNAKPAPDEAPVVSGPGAAASDVTAMRRSVDAVLPGSVSAGGINPTGESMANEVLVKFRPGAAASDVAAVHQAADADQGDKLSQLGNGVLYRIRSRSKNTEALIRALQHNPNIEYVEPNEIIHLEATPNDPSYPYLWGLRNVGQPISAVNGKAGADISAPIAWSLTTGSADIVVGVVDTGIDYTHPDLAPNIWNNPGGKGNPNCAAGTHGFNAITKSCDPKDDHYHGTHVAGTIGAAGNNNLGVVGVNWTTSIMGLKFLASSGYGNTADAIAAIDFAVQAKIDGVNVRVLNNSWGGGAFSKALFDEILKANENDILFVASAGNSAYNTDVQPEFPAAYGAPNLLSVAATDNRDELAYFSNYGANTVHLGAPGVDTISTFPASQYSSLSGTSMAAPHVSGVAALVLAHSPGLNVTQLRAAILAGVDPIASLAGKTTTGGRLNAAKALGIESSGPDFTVTTSVELLSILRGSSATVELTVTPSGGFSDDVTFAVAPTSSNVQASISPTSTQSSATLTLTTSAATPTGDYTIIINALSGELAHSHSFKLRVVATVPSTVCPVFESGVTPSVYASNSSAAVSDFDRDGNLDIAVVSAALNGTSIELGSPSGKFVAGVSFNTPGGPIAVIADDLNRDGKPDLATAHSMANQVSVRLGLGDGQFSAPLSAAVGANPFALTSGDFNGDSIADIAVANNGSSDVSILLGLGDGSFAAAVNYVVGSGPYWIGSDDLDGDGHEDLVVAVHNASAAAVLLGLGDGTFASAINYPMGSATSSVQIGDVNRDGRMDLVASGFNSDDVLVRIGVGDGTFGPTARFAVGDGPTSVAIVDLNGDGKCDLVASNSVSQSLSILYGTGDGNFSAAETFAVSGDPAQVLGADFNRDGLADLAIVPVAANQLRILRNLGNCRLNCGSMTPLPDHPAGATPVAAAAGDFNRDGIADVAVANQTSDTVSIALGLGDGTFGPSMTFAAGDAPAAVTAADLNDDGIVDLAVGNATSNNVSVLLGIGDGSFLLAVNYHIGTAPAAIVVSDLNRDGRVDLAVANRDSNDVSILLANLAGGYSPATPTAAGTNPSALVTGDFDRDGIADLAVANRGSNDVAICRGRGDGTFDPASILPAGDGPSDLIAADLNRDGKLDLAIANEGSGNVSILLGNGDGAFSAAAGFTAGPTPSSVAVGDFDRNGTADLAITDRDSASVSIFFGKGDGKFALATDHAAGTAPGALVATDLNSDGGLDIVAVNQGSASLTVLLNSCPVPDLVVTKSHVGDAAQGERGKAFTITVTNAGGGATSGLVVVTDTLPPGMAAASLSGDGWYCSLGTTACSRTDALAPSASYPPITLTVNIVSNAPPSLTNNVTVAGGMETNMLNDDASDMLTVASVTDLAISLTHTSAFSQGAVGKKYAISVRNSGGTPTSGTVTVTDSLPAGLTATALSGSGWSCTLAPLVCTRSDALASGATYPTITLTVNVASDAPAAVTNAVTLAGGGDAQPANNQANDLTTIWDSESCGGLGVAAINPVYAEPREVVMRDVNADGITDLLTTHAYGGVSVLLGTGNGAFAPATRFATNIYAQYSSAADLNGDGVLDIVTTNAYSNSVTTILGLGDGTFTQGPSRTDIVSPYEIKTSDFNGDGWNDAALIGGSPAALYILPGNGDGSFRTPVKQDLSSSPTTLDVGDFDGDGIVDIVVGTSTSRVAVLRGHGDGTFEQLVSYAVDGTPTLIARADLNDDGRLDLVASTYYEDVAVFIGTGGGNFSQPAYYNFSYSYTRALAIEDVNGDGKQDVTVLASGVGIFAGNGDGTLKEAIWPLQESSYYGLAVGDLNDDGKADFAVSGGYPTSISVMLGGCADLKIAKSHSGTFRGGQTSAKYLLVVSNTGDGSSAGPVTVTDTLPAGLTASYIYGYGWSCTLATATCTRSTSVQLGASFDPIELYVSVSTSAAASVTNVATVSGGSERNTTNNSASDPTTIVNGPDLRIMKNHNQTFTPGGSGLTYSISVSNDGTTSTSGTVTVTDALPAGLTATAMSGSGWTCNLGTLTCTRTDSLAASQTYPTISVTVSVSPSCAPTVTNVATVAGSGDIDPTNNVASDITFVIYPPSGIESRATSTSSVTVSWNVVVGAYDYLVHRATGNGSFSLVAYVNSPFYIDTSVTPNTVYRYKVQGRNAGAVGPFSITVSSVTMAFTDDPIVAGATTIKASHFNELRTGVNLMRAAAGLQPATFTDPDLTGAAVKSVHYSELWERLNEARAALGVVLLSYSDHPMQPGKPITAQQIAELRDALK